MDNCFYCGKQISGAYYTDWQGNKCCAEHYDIIRCASCQCFLKPDVPIRLTDPNRVICETCYKNSVNADNFPWVKQQVLNRLIKVGFQDIQCDWINFRIVSQQEMESMCENASGLQFAASIFDETVQVLAYTNKIEFAAILAHELLHSWQLQNNINEYNNYNINDRNQKICEGFAQMGSYLIYSTIDHPFAKWCLERMFRNTDEVYGKSFITIYNRYKQIGWHGIIREARQQKLKHLFR